MRQLSAPRQFQKRLTMEGPWWALPEAGAPWKRPGWYIYLSITIHDMWMSCCMSPEVPLTSSFSPNFCRMTWEDHGADWEVKSLVKGPTGAQQCFDEHHISTSTLIWPPWSGRKCQSQNKCPSQNRGWIIFPFTLEIITRMKNQSM
jgi:hypothetical protein